MIVAFHSKKTITCLNLKISWNIMTFDAKKIFGGVLNLHGGILASSHALHHSCHQLRLFLVQMMVSCKIVFVFYLLKLRLG